MRRKLVIAFRADRDLADGKALAELEQPAFGVERARPGFLQEIDAQVRGHRERHPSDRGEHGDVHRCVRQVHQGRARDRSARAQRFRPKSVSQPRPAVRDRHNGKAAAGMEGLRELGCQPTPELVERDGRIRHGSPLSPPPRLGLTFGGRRPLSGYNGIVFSERPRVPAMNAPAPALRNAPALPRETRNGIALLTMNRPEQRNTLSEAMLASFAEVLAQIAADRAVRAVVLAANGPVFCAGHDLKELTARRADADGGKSYFQYIMETCSSVMQAIVGLPQPVIAAVQGLATAAGCQLVASCDLAVASAQAKFCTPGVDIGLFCSTPMVALSRNVATKHAMEMLLTGDRISADEAQRIGLVNRVVEPGSEADAALALARKIAEKSTLTVKIGKAAFYRQREMPLAEAYRYASQVMTENMMARDAEEGICAVLDKRAPRWEDR